MAQAKRVIALNFLDAGQAVAFQWSEDEIDSLCYAMNCDKIRYRFAYRPAARNIPKMSAESIELICLINNLDINRFTINYKARMKYNSQNVEEYYDDHFEDSGKDDELNDDFYQTTWEDRQDFADYYEDLRAVEDD